MVHRLSPINNHIDGEIKQYFSLSVYFLIHKRLLPVTWDGLTLVSLDHKLVYFASHKYRLEFDNTGPAWIWTWISGTKSFYATIVLCSIDFFFLFFFSSVSSFFWCCTLNHLKVCVQVSHGKINCHLLQIRQTNKLYG